LIHSAIPVCSDCGEPIQRYVNAFSDASVAEEVVACDCEAVTISYTRDPDPPAESIPDSWR